MQQPTLYFMNKHGALVTLIRQCGNKRELYTHTSQNAQTKLNMWKTITYIHYKHFRKKRRNRVGCKIVAYWVKFLFFLFFFCFQNHPT